MRTKHDGPRRRWPGRWRQGRGWAAALVLVVAGSAVTVAGTVAVTAVPAGAGTTVPVVSAGGGGSCAAEPDQTVWCWGSNGFGQLGDGSTTGSMLPVKVSTLPPAVSVSAGQASNASSEIHACAVGTAGQVWCWGSNFYGELGVGTTSTDIKDPVLVPGLQASQVSAGDQFTCAVTLAHTAECWGDNNFGELGNGTNTDSSKPVKVKGLTNVTEVAAGYFHACALESNGTVWCWGDNGNGELGNGTTTASNQPVLASVEGATEVAAGNSDTCAIASGGRLLCWGLNSTGQLGTGNFTDQSLPAQVIGLSSGVQQVGLGLDFGCALADEPTPLVLCWGDNGGNGTLGNGSFSHPASKPVPSLVFGLKTPPSGAPGGPEQITVGTRHACVVMTTGLVQCWGQGGSGRLGSGNTMDRDIPTPVIGLPLPAGSANAVTAGIETGCAINKELTAACWGRWTGDGGSLATIHTSAVPVQAAVSQVSAGWGGCALVHNGGLSTEVRCWGTDKTGQLGDGVTGKNARSPVTVSNLSHVQYISNGGADNCALVQNGGARCWGYNAWGELGDGSTTSTNVPVTVQGLPSSLAQIAAALDHTCALLKNGTVRCWGQNNNGQLGDGSTSDSHTPVAVTSLSGVVQIAVGDELTCALTSAGSVDCWGDGEFGELGNGQSGSGIHSDVPVVVSGLTSGVVSIGTSDAGGCASLFTGQVECWGDNSAGELGTGSVGTPALSSSPVTVGGFTAGGPIGVSAGSGASSCALSSSLQPFCWGDNSVGELGDGSSGTAADSGTPVAVQGL